MTSSISFTTLLLLLLLVAAQGIRLQRVMPPSSHQEIHEGEKESKLVEETGDVEEVVLCKNEQCSGRSRKLMTNTKSTSKNMKNKGLEIGATAGHHSSKEVDGNQENSSKSTVLEHQQSTNEHYPADIIDITGMDYSVVRRRPPIHN